MRKMIQVMDEQMSPGVLSAFETGRNLFNIIGAAESPSAAWNSFVLVGNFTEYFVLSVSR